MKTLSDIALPQIGVLDSSPGYREAGSPGDPVALFLHGNPTSSYLWRNIIPLVAPAHCIAPDLIGFGQSGKPGIEYRFADHVRYLDAFLANAGIESAFVIAHDWGSALAFHLAARRPEFVRGLARGVHLAHADLGRTFIWTDAKRFSKFRTAGIGEQMILEDNAFIETVLPANIVRKLSDEEMAIYRAPFPTRESRIPTWRFPNELPIAGQPADVYAMMERAHEALVQSSYPKLLLGGDPGVLVSPAFADRFARKLTDCTCTSWPGLHYLQEDHRGNRQCRREVDRRAPEKPKQPSHIGGLSGLLVMELLQPGSSGRLTCITSTSVLVVHVPLPSSVSAQLRPPASWLQRRGGHSRSRWLQSGFSHCSATRPSAWLRCLRPAFFWISWPPAHSTRLGGFAGPFSSSSPPAYSTV